ncbi:Rho-binding antiterminator [Vibrio penaeicida]|uniref:Rho-binding antiterminator n=1 Tax=Vibrio penaeicida TaxID=104609 RepID=UPI0027370960|nr:Rho-binding antiterminator [Vibrio penaeicida]MDP2571237.1 Rho-binding antiterminator [Vibrio penaeicida]
MISCDKYDFIELACLFKLKVSLAMLSGEQIEGVAHNTKIGADRVEYLILTHWVVDETDVKETAVRLDDIHTMSAKTANPHFTTIHINDV